MNNQFTTINPNVKEHPKDYFSVSSKNITPLYEFIYSSWCHDPLYYPNSISNPRFIDPPYYDSDLYLDDVDYLDDPAIFYGRPDLCNN